MHAHILPNNLYEASKVTELIFFFFYYYTTLKQQIQKKLKTIPKTK